MRAKRRSVFLQLSNGQPKVGPATSFGVISRRREVGEKAASSRGCRVVAGGKRRRRGRIALQSWPTAFAVLVD